MAGTPITVMFQGRQEEGILLDVVSAQEHFHTLRLSDGSVLRVKLVASSVIRLNSVQDGLRFPMYLLQSSNVLSVERGPTPLKEGVH